MVINSFDATLSGKIINGITHAIQKDGIELLESYFRQYNKIENWLVTSEYNLEQKNRPTNVFSFSIIPIGENIKETAIDLSH